jgi:hypothetical protein
VFQVVGRGFSPEIGDEGAVSGRLTDGYLTAIGNFDADMNGMSGGGPYYQQVGGMFFLDSAQTRFPCSLTVSFWRNTFTSSDPPASAALTDNRVRITCLAGQFAIQGGALLLNPGEYYEFVGGIPVSTTGDPHSSTGTYGGVATCDNTQVSIQARIEWNVQPRVHVLLGIVRECYEEGNPCATYCSGNPAPNALYLTLSGFSTSSGTLHASYPSGTYVIDRVPLFCNSYITPLEDCNGVTYALGPFIPFVGVNHNWLSGYTGSENVFMGFGFRDSRGCCMSFLLRLNVPSLPCVSSTGVSGTALWSVVRGGFFAPVDDPCRFEANNDANGTLFWTISS